eukprot:2566309-Alexandrium_andersonii.AAC.1
MDQSAQLFLRSVSFELCVYRRDQVDVYQRVQMAMIETAAMQPWRHQPQRTAADLQLPELSHEA